MSAGQLPATSGPCWEYQISSQMSGAAFLFLWIYLCIATQEYYINAVA